MRRSRQNIKQPKPSWRKASGEEKFFFIFHNLLSMVLFFYTARKVDLFGQQSYSFLDIISFKFIQLIGVVIGLTLLFGLLSRAIVYGIFRIVNYYKNEKKKGTSITTMKSFIDMNRGINEFTTFSYLKIQIYSSIAFAIGIIAIVQIKIFQSNKLWALISAYTIVKLVIYVWVWAKDK